MLVTNVNTNVLTVTRAYGGTVATTHATGKLVTNAVASPYHSTSNTEIAAIESVLTGGNAPGRGWQILLGKSIDTGDPSSPYNVGDPIVGGFYAGTAGTPHSGGVQGVESFMNMNSSWLGTGKPYAAFRADVLAQTGSTSAPTGMFINIATDSGTSGGYGIWATLSDSQGNVVNPGLMTAYLEGRDYTSAGTNPINIAALELNINTHSGPTFVDYGVLGMNIVRQCQAPCPGAGDVKAGSAIQAGGSGNGHADWSQFLRFLQGYDSAVVLHVDNQNPGGVKGMWRVMNSGGQFSFRTNTAAGRDFSTYAAALTLDTDGTVYLGGDGGLTAITGYFGANNGTIVLGGGAGVAVGGAKVTIGGTTLAIPAQHSTTGTRYLCISTTGLVTSSASACSGT
jgi:hypothetical protein